MATKIGNILQSEELNGDVQGSQGNDGSIGCSIGIMAYNEEANIARTLLAVLEQNGPSFHIEEVIVVASGCTDRTVPIVAEITLKEPRVRLCVQEKREGKASAINLFLKQATSPIVVLIGADVIPEVSAIENLCAPFKDPKIGMVGWRPVPVNDSTTFMGHSVHLLWRLHDRLARISPKLGEVIAFRNVISGIPTNSAVDEISIQAVIFKYGLRLVYEPEAIVYNKGPMTVRDFLKQRRRIHAGHLKVRASEHYEASTMNVRSIAQELAAYAPYIMGTPKQAVWTLGTIGLEGLARLQGHYDVMRKHSHHVWQAVATTKMLEDEQRKLRRICNTQSVIVFHLKREGADEGDFQREREERSMIQVTRKLLPLLRRHMRRDDLLSLNGADTLVAVLNAERSGAELIALRLKQVIEEQHVSIGKEGSPRLLVRYHAVSFGE